MNTYECGMRNGNDSCWRRWRLPDNRRRSSLSLLRISRIAMWSSMATNASPLSNNSAETVIWPLNEVQALVLDRSLHWSERESALEEGWLLAELEQGFGYGLEELARQFDRSVSWVSRRLVELLPDSVSSKCARARSPRRWR